MVVVMVQYSSPAIDGCPMGRHNALMSRWERLAK